MRDATVRPVHRRVLMISRVLTAYFTLRDSWIGVQVAHDAVYVRPLPFLVFRYYRHGRVPFPPGTRHEGTCRKCGETISRYLGGVWIDELGRVAHFIDGIGEGHHPGAYWMVAE